MQFPLKKVVYIVWTCGFVCSGLVSANEERKPIPLRIGGIAIPKQETQQLQPNCLAKRSWYELSEMTGKNEEIAINRWIRKKMTVGKKLKSSDCPELSSNEQYDYSNSSAITGQWMRHTGIYVSVYFPGGSGRYSWRCSVVDQQTGKSMDLKTKLTAKGKKGLLAILSKDDPTYSIKQWLEASELCLTDEGVVVKTFHAGRKILAKETNLDADQIRSFFTWSRDFDPELAQLTVHTGPSPGVVP